VIEVRTLDPADTAAAWKLARTAFNSSPDHEGWFRGRVDQGVFLAVYDAARLVGIAAVHSYRQWFAGRDIPMAGLASVAVAPEARGRGVGRALLGAAINRAYEDGAAISVLYPSVPPVYRSAGWELAGVLASAELPTSALSRARAVNVLGAAEPEPVTLRPAEKDDLDAVHALYTAVASPAVGPLTRTGPLFDVAKLLTLDGALLAERAGDPVGYVCFDRGGDPGLTVYDLVGGAPDVLAELLRVIGSWEMVAPKVRLRAVDPALLALCVPVPVPLSWDFIWMARLIDVQKAVAGRGWPVTVRTEVDLELVDSDAPWQSGRWRLEVGDGSGTLERGGTGAVRVHVRGLSSLFTGFASTVALRAAGLLDGDAVAAARLDAAFAGHLPWMVDYF
jgi:predicted acetyltransferase